MRAVIKYKPHDYIRPFHAERMKYFIRAIVTGYGGGKCIMESSKILTTEGLVNIEKVNQGDFVYTFTGDKYILSQVEQRLDTGILNAIEIKLQGGYKITVSSEHPFLKAIFNKSHDTLRHIISSEWTKADSLSTGNFIAVPSKLPIGKNNIPNSEIIGYLLGNGCLTQRGLLISIADENVIGHVQNILPDDCYLQKIKGGNVDYRIKTSLSEVRNELGQISYSHPLMDQVRELGLMGLNSHTKTIPSEFFNANEESIKGILSGLFVTDGWVDRKYLAFTSVSEDLADGIKILLLKLGIVSNKSKKRIKYNNGLAYTIYISRKEDLQKCLHNLNLLHKGERLKKLIEDKQNNKLPKGKACKHFYKDNHYARIKSIKEVGKVQMYDLSIEGTHNFIAENILVHNTYAGCMELLECSGINQGVPNVYVEPTYQMIKDILEPELISILDENSIPYQHNKSEHNFFLPLWDGHIWFRSGDKPEKLKGINVGVFGIDEPFIQDEEIFKIAISRARHPEAKVKGIFLTGTPEELNWGYDLLITKIKDNTKMYHGTTIDNVGYLGSDYVEQMREHYTEKEIQAYIEGKFVNLNYGNCYYAFTDENITNYFDYMAYRPLEISCDFNVGLMCWNISQELNGKDYTFDFVEIQGEANTYKMCDQIKIKYPNHRGGLIFYGDISGNSRDPSSAISSWGIIQECFPEAALYYQPIKNIGDRVNATNARMKNSRGIINYYITKKCERLIKDFRQVTWELLQNKNKAKDLTHASDGYSYQAFWKYPQYGKSIRRGSVII